MFAGQGWGNQCSFSLARKAGWSAPSIAFLFRIFCAFHMQQEHPISGPQELACSSIQPLVQCTLKFCSCAIFYSRCYLTSRLPFHSVPSFTNMGTSLSDAPAEAKEQKVGSWKMLPGSTRSTTICYQHCLGIEAHAYLEINPLTMSSKLFKNKDLQWYLMLEVFHAKYL